MHGMHSSSTFWPEGCNNTPSNQMGMFMWVVAWLFPCTNKGIFLCTNKGMKCASASEKEATISIRGVQKLPRFTVLSLKERHFGISPDWGLSMIVTGPKVHTNTISGRDAEPKYQMS